MTKWDTTLSQYEDTPDAESIRHLVNRTKPAQQVCPLR